MWIVVIIAAGLITALIHLGIIGFSMVDIGTICSIIVLHQFVVTHGLIAIIGFYMNVLTGEKTSKNLGWPGGPYQIKYGFSQLGLGVMGILSIWLRGNFWIGTLVTLYIYGISGLWTHTLEMKKKGKLDWIELGNIILDIIYHIVLTILTLYVPGVWSLV